MNEFPNEYINSPCNDQKTAVLAEYMTLDFQKAVQNVYSEKQKGILAAMRTVFWLAKEDIAINKYDSLLTLLGQLDCPHLESLVFIRRGSM